MHPTTGEVGERSGALALSAAAVDRCRLDAGLAELLGKPVGPVSGPTENDGRPHCTYGLCGDPRAVDLGHVPEHVMGCGNIRGLLSDLVTDGILLVVAGEPGHIAVEGRGEQHGLALAYRLVEQPANGGHEAHVGHSVGLVEHDPVGCGEAHDALVDEILQPSGTGDQDVDTPPEGLDLGDVANTAIDDSDADRAGERAKHGVDLFGKLTCRCQYERAWPLGLSTADAGDERDPKGERLA